MQFDIIRIKPIAIGLLCIVAVTCAIVVRVAYFDSRLKIEPQEGRVFSPPVKISAFNLIDHKGQPFTNLRLKGHWTLVSIGFTYCPDVCPLTLAKIAEFYSLLDKAGLYHKRPEYIFLSVDPFRDSLGVLADYVTFYHPEFIGVTGSPEGIYQFVDGLGLYYRYVGPDGKSILQDVLHRPENSKYSVIHSAQLLIINPDGEVRVMISNPFYPARLTAIYENLIKN